MIILCIWYPSFNYHFMWISPWRSIYWFLMAVIIIGRRNFVVSHMRSLVHSRVGTYSMAINSSYCLLSLLSHDLFKVTPLFGWFIVEIFLIVLILNILLLPRHFYHISDCWRGVYEFIINYFHLSVILVNRFFSYLSFKKRFISAFYLLLLTCIIKELI